MSMRLPAHALLCCLALVACDGTLPDHDPGPRPGPPSDPSDPTPPSTPSNPAPSTPSNPAPSTPSNPDPSTPPATPTDPPGSHDPGPPPSACAPGWSCAGALELGYCADGALETWDCDDVCRDAGHARATTCGLDAAGEATCFCEDDTGPIGCYDYEEPCGDGTCLDTAYVCDGIADCATGSDEIGCATCGFAGGVCNGDQHVDTCDGGAITTWSCEAICADQGFAVSDGCWYDPAAGSDACYCSDLPECVPGEVWCTGDYTLEACDADGFWVDWDCDEVCQQSGHAWSEGCGFDSYAGADGCFCSD